jgi:hypothetical protein
MTEKGICWGCEELKELVAITANTLGAGRLICGDCADSGEYDLFEPEEFADEPWNPDNPDEEFYDEELEDDE